VCVCWGSVIISVSSYLAFLLIVQVCTSKALMESPSFFCTAERGRVIVTDVSQLKRRKTAPASASAPA